jgi:hypothetical protein
MFRPETDAFRWRVVSHAGRVDARGRRRPGAGGCPGAPGSALDCAPPAAAFAVRPVRAC